MTLETLIKEKYAVANASNDLTFFESISTQIVANGIQFHINLVPSLAQKPKTNDNKDDKKDKTDSKPENPFLNPDPALVVQQYDKYNLLLNKFCVFPHHLLITTKDFQPQTQPLFPPDLMIGWKTLMTAYGPSSPGILFYNCGPDSGASQSHKHLQVIPLLEDGVQPPIQQAINNIENSKAGEIYTLDQLPFVHVLTPLDRAFMDDSPDEAVEDYLGQMFFGLLDAMFQQLRFLDDDQQAINRKTSFNFIMTSKVMMLVPRRQESGYLEDNVVISMNSLCFAGFLLARDDKEFNALQQVDCIMDLLTQIGFPKPTESSEQPEEQGSLAT
ncbi:HIT-like domain-containing protein [Chlamydoabsidia padenii]|nr:HIT-like domain-containing protein [Chlamydoabsidia padenii]